MEHLILLQMLLVVKEAEVEEQGRQVGHQVQILMEAQDFLIVLVELLQLTHVEAQEVLVMLQHIH